MNLPNPVPAHQSTPANRIEEWRVFLTAVAFLTRIPVDRFTRQQQPIALQRCVIYFPLVGLLIGLLTSAAIAIGCLLWPDALVLAVIVAIACELLLTGAFHEDALADFFDAFGGGWTRDDVLRILKDSRLGAYGTLALLFGVGLRVAATAYLVLLAKPFVWVLVIAVSAMIGRWMIVLTMALLPPVEQRDSLSRDIGGQVSWDTFKLCSCYVAPFAILFVCVLPVRALLAAVLVTLATLALYLEIRRKLGGVTGDCLGCIGYVTQVLIVLAACG